VAPSGAIVRHAGGRGEVALKQFHVGIDEQRQLEEHAFVPETKGAAADLAVLDTEVGNAPQHQGGDADAAKRSSDGAAVAPEHLFRKTLGFPPPGQHRRRQHSRRENDCATSRGPHHHRNAIVPTVAEVELAPRIARPREHHRYLSDLFDVHHRRCPVNEVEPRKRDEVGRERCVRRRSFSHK